MIRRAIAFFIVATITTALSITVISAPAGACSCQSPSDQQAAEQADVVFTGTLVQRGSPSSGYSAELVRYTFAVDEVFKGQAQETQVVVTEASGASCGLEITGTGPFAVYASTSTSTSGESLPKGSVYASLCGGTRVLSTTAPAGTGRSPTPGRSAPSSPPGERPAWVLPAAGLIALAAAIGAFTWFRRRSSRASGLA